MYWITLCFSLSCTKQEKCGTIYDKITQNERYFFILDAAFSYDVSTNNDIASFLPDNRMSGEVSASVYNQYAVGDEYCQ